MYSTRRLVLPLLAAAVILAPVSVAEVRGSLGLGSLTPGAGTPPPVVVAIDGGFDDWTDDSAFLVTDEGGRDDFSSPGHLDVTRFGVASDRLGSFFVLVAFDDPMPGRGVAATLIDVDLDGRSDHALVATLDEGSTTVMLFACDDTVAFGCGDATLTRSFARSAFAANTAPGPWDDDLHLEIALPFADLAPADGTIVFTALVSYAATSLLTSPKDSVLGALDQDYEGGIRYDGLSGEGLRIALDPGVFHVRRHSDPSQVRSAPVHAVTLRAPFDDEFGTLADGQTWYYVVETPAGLPRSLSAHPNVTAAAVRLGFDDGLDDSAPVDPTMSTVTLDVTDVAADGTAAITVTVTPRDQYGIPLGAGCLVTLDEALLAPGEVVGAAVDHLDGSYTFKVVATSAGIGTVMTDVEGLVLDDLREVTFY